MNNIIKEKFKIIGLLIVLLTISCNPSLNLTILFDEAPYLEENSEVVMESKKIGRVLGKEVKKDVTRVRIAIQNEYKKKIREDSKFYYVTRKGEPRIEVITADKTSPEIENNEVLRGHSEYRYWFDLGLKKTKEGVTDFFESEGWKNFKKNFKEELDESSQKGKEWVEEELPKIKEKADEMFKRFEEEYGKEAREKAKAYVDSLLIEARKNNGS